jgi:hypothetical protein
MIELNFTQFAEKAASAHKVKDGQNKSRGEELTRVVFPVACRQ